MASDFPKNARAALEKIEEGMVIEDVNGNRGQVKRKTTDSSGRPAVMTTHGRHGSIVRADMLYTYTVVYG